MAFGDRKYVVKNWTFNDTALAKWFQKNGIKVGKAKNDRKFFVKLSMEKFINLRAKFWESEKI